MTVTASSPFRSPPRISRSGFRRLMQDKAAPAVTAERDPGEYWDAIVATGIDPLLVAAIFQHESTMGRYGVAQTTHSWGNTRAPSFGATPTGTTPGRTGEFPIFRNWLDGAVSTAARLAAPNYVYANRTAIRDIFDWPADPDVVWAPAGDLNDPAGYLRSVIDFMNQYEETDTETPAPVTTHIALSAGHRNTSGGDAHEKEQTARLTPALAQALRAAGFDVRVVQGNDGRDMFPGGLHDVAKQVVAWDQSGWRVDCYIEIHTEGGPKVPGMFVIYPSMNGDLDTDVRDTLGPAIVAAVTADTGLGKRGNGLMPESSTGVGGQGDRLGIFAYTVPIKDHTERLIIEVGAHDVPSDLAIVDAPAFPALFGGAVARALAAYYGVSAPQPAPKPETPPDTSTPPRPANVGDPTARYFPETGHWLQWGFKGFWDSYGDDKAIPAFGYPLSDELQEGGLTVQYFERAVFEWHVDIQRVLLRRLGAEAYEEREAA